jgi:choline-sulfatase
MKYGNLSNKPNIIVLMTDQQRVVQYFPKNWVNENLTNLKDLKNTGIDLTNAHTNSCRCSPVRGMLWTGLYPPRSGVTAIGPQATLSSKRQTLGKILGPEYSGNIAFKGKWHLTESFSDASEIRPSDPTVLSGQNQQMATDYGMEGWDAPDVGNALGWESTAPTSDSSINTLGGGLSSPTQNDARITTDALDFLTAQKGSNNPFFLAVSLVNPHDVWSKMYSGMMKDAYLDYPQAMNKLKYSNEFTESILPASYSGDDLTTKPSIQSVIRESYTETYSTNNNISPIPTMLSPADALDYLKFYAYLTYLADQHMSRVYDFLKTNGMLNNTIILRLADHGEMAMSHGGMMEKDCNFYRETVNVPMIFSNPVLWPAPVESKALIGLVDIVPTLLSIAGVNYNSTDFQGTDFSKFILNPIPSAPQDKLLYTYDDDYPVHIRAIRTAPGTISVDGDSNGYKYAVYYSYKLNSQSEYEVNPTEVQFELYDMENDPEELTNLLPTNAGAGSHALAVQKVLHPMLTNLMKEADQKGPGGTKNPIPPIDPTSYVGPAITPYGWQNIVI